MRLINWEAELDIGPASLGSYSISLSLIYYEAIEFTDSFTHWEEPLHPPLRGLNP